MPKNAVKTKLDKKLWERAKRLASEQGYGSNYAYIMSIYKRLKEGQ